MSFVAQSSSTAAIVAIYTKITLKMINLILDLLLYFRQFHYKGTWQQEIVKASSIPCRCQQR